MNFLLEKPNGTSGLIFNIEGPSACPFQFYMTDSSYHFFRGALYFNTVARVDSLKPYTERMKTDMMRLINTLNWK